MNSLAGKEFTVGVPPFDISIGHIFNERPRPIAQSDTHIELMADSYYTCPPRGSILVGVTYDEKRKLTGGVAYDLGNEIAWLYLAEPLDAWTPGGPVPPWCMNRGTVSGMKITTTWYAHLEFGER